ncbi:MAG: hypothetical protein HY259_14485 [Chloroflexi bacterium]|nr:hypothetical protein [Chloroflexota bacterium]
MLKGEKVILRAIQREDLKRQWEFNNDVEVELSGGGDPPMPQSLAPDWIGGEFDENARKGGRDGALFAIEADGLYIGQCGVFTSGIIGSTAQTYELGIAIGDKRCWGRAPDPSRGAMPCVSCSTTLFDCATRTKFGCASMAPTSAPSAPIAPADLWKKAACAGMSGATGSILIWSIWASCARSGSNTSPFNGASPGNYDIIAVNPTRPII